MHLLGAVLAILSAATFALTNATGRRGVITGTPAQGMVISMPVGLACFGSLALLTGGLQAFSGFSISALVALSAAAPTRCGWATDGRCCRSPAQS